MIASGMALVKALVRYAAIANVNNPFVLKVLRFIHYLSRFRIKRLLILLVMLSVMWLLSVLPTMLTLPSAQHGVSEEVEIFDDTFPEMNSQLLPATPLAEERRYTATSQQISQEFYKGTIAQLYKPGFSMMPKNPGLCSAGANGAGGIFFLIMIFSSPGNLALRRAIRETWGDLANYPDGRLAFVIGQTNKYDQAAITLEAKLYNDVVQGNFVDTYDNLPLKTMAILEWASTYCKKAKFVIKIDDDMFLNVERLLELLRQQDTSKPAIFGHLRNQIKPERNASSRYFISVDQYPQDYYPPYCSGQAYVMTANLAKPLLQEIMRSEYFRMEDILVTGFAAGRLGAKLVNIPAMYDSNPPKTLDGLRSAATFFAKYPCRMYRYWALTSASKTTETFAISYESEPLVFNETNTPM